MNYYILPKNNFNIDIKPIFSNEDVIPCISYSLIHYLNDVYKQLLLLENTSDEFNIEYINKIVNPFEFIHTNVPGSITSVSKVKPESNIFFELMEICQVCNMSSVLSPSICRKMVIAHMTPNHTSTNYLINMLREDCDDTIINEKFDYNYLRDKYLLRTPPLGFSIDFFVFEFNDQEYANVKKYLKNMLLMFFIVIKNQNEGGSCIIKIDNIFYKVMVDMLFIFSCVYEKVFIIKPSMSKITKGERYIVCKNRNEKMVSMNSLVSQFQEKIEKCLNEELNVHSLISNQIPYHFMNKIEESNAVIGQQQLESYDLIINIFKNKNKDDKIEALKRNHIQKCIQWCERNQLPHNKFTDKINIFLNSKNQCQNQCQVQGQGQCQ